MKRIIIVGPAAAGKDYLKEKLRKKDYKIDVSYTTRSIREGEKYGVDYNYISKDEFTLRISQGAFYEFVKHGPDYYGTGKYEWNNCDVFIMETEGIASIKEKDRKDCFIIYLDPLKTIRQSRLKFLRGWDSDKIQNRFKIDEEKFNNFTNYDIRISNPDF